jgi:acyl-coenzyme A synthetase/AMP-(fatty) acid ligase
VQLVQSEQPAAAAEILNVFDALPATSTGKILKHKLAESLCSPATSQPVR